MDTSNPDSRLSINIRDGSPASFQTIPEIRYLSNSSISIDFVGQFDILRIMHDQSNDSKRNR